MSGAALRENRPNWRQGDFLSPAQLQPSPRVGVGRARGAGLPAHLCRGRRQNYRPSVRSTRVTE